MFDALKNIGKMGEMLKNAEAMKGKLKSLQEDLARRTVTTEAAGGMVRATVNGKMELLQLQINREKVEPGEMRFVQEAIVTAVVAAQRKAAEMMAQEMSKQMSEMGIPPGLLGG